MNNYIFSGPRKVIKIEKSNLIANRPVLLRGWKVSLKIHPTGIYGGWSNILHATIGRDLGRHGDRTPGIWFLPGTTRMHICSTVNGNPNYCFNSKALPLHKESRIVIKQVQRLINYQYYYQVIIDGKKVVDVLNENAQIFKNVKYYASDKWYHPAKASISNFHLVTYKHIGKNKKHLFLRTKYCNGIFQINTVM